MPVEPIPQLMLAPDYQVSWAGKEDPNSNDASEMMPALMVFNVFMGIGGYFVWNLCKKNKVPFWETMIALWMWVDACTHLILEVPFILALPYLTTIQHSFLALNVFGADVWPAKLFAPVWREYGHADKRWAYLYDPCVFSLEILTVYVVGPLCLVALYGIIQRKKWFHFAQLVLSVSELYGGFMTFGPEWFVGSPNLNTSTWKLLYLYLFFFNFIWVVVPIGVCYYTFLAMQKGIHLSHAPATPAAASPSPRGRSRTKRQ